MRLPSRLLRVALLPASLWLGLGAEVSAQDTHEHMAMPAPAAVAALHRSRWSDPASWPEGRVPRAGDAVIIPRDREIVLDVAPPALRSLTINGKLSFADDRDTELKTDWIYLAGGELDIGSEAHPFTRKATITLTDTVPNEDVNTMGDRGIMMTAGTLSLHGNRSNAWTKLASTAKAGSATIRVLNASGWRAGDQIVLASTDFDPHQAEERTITGVNGNALTLDQPLKYMHFGEITYGVDERGEVGLLTRNIKIQASDDAAQNYFGGHIMAMAGSHMYLSGIELNRMGQNMHLARYPVHWHLGGDGKGQYIENSAIHDTYSRCVTVHGTDNLRVQNNVTFNTVGHCFFMEDGIEHGNQFVHNLGILTKCHPTLPCQPTNLGIPSERPAGNGQASDHVLIPSDNTVATYWITNPANSYIDNVAAGSEVNGFWLSLPEHPTGAFKDTAISAQTWPRRTPIEAFRGNTAHSNYDGFMFDRNVAADGKFSVTGTVYLPRANPADGTSRPVENTFSDLTSYKNRNGGLWMRGEATVFRNLHMADNAIGMTFASGLGGADFTSKTFDSLFVGESANIGNPLTPAEVAYGRSLPKPQVADFPIRGYEFYDLLHALSNVTFVNFQDNATRKTGAMSYLLFTSFGMSPENSVEGLHFQNAKPVYFPPREQRWASDFASSAAYLTAAIHDKDGSASGVANSYIVFPNGIAEDDQACEMRPSWGAAVCKGDYGRLSLGGGGLARPGAGAAPEPPITLSRNGRTFDYHGQATLRSGVEVTVDTTKPSLPLRLSSMDDGSWVVLKLPGFTSADKGVKQASMAALQQASETSYYNDGGTLWVKLFPAKDGVQSGINVPPSITVSRGEAVAANQPTNPGGNLAGRS